MIVIEFRVSLPLAEFDTHLAAVISVVNPHRALTTPVQLNAAAKRLRRLCRAAGIDASSVRDDLVVTSWPANIDQLVCRYADDSRPPKVFRK